MPHRVHRRYNATSSQEADMEWMLADVRAVPQPDRPPALCLAINVKNRLTHTRPGGGSSLTLTRCEAG